MAFIAVFLAMAFAAVSFAMAAFAFVFTTFAFAVAFAAIGFAVARLTIRLFAFTAIACFFAMSLITGDWNEVFAIIALYRYIATCGHEYQRNGWE